MPDFARQVLDALPFTVYTTDLAGQITSVNRSWSQFAGENGAPTLVNERNVCGLSLWSALGDTSYRRQVEGALEDLRTGRVPAVTWEFPCSSPSDERVFLMQITPLRDRDHHPTGFVFSTVDITPSHRSREALIETGLALARPIDLDRLFVEVGHQVRRALPALEFSVWLSAPDDPAPRLAHAVSQDGDTSSAERRFSGVVAATLAGHVAARSVDGAGISLAVPMVSEGRVLGAMALYAEALTTRQALEEAERVLATLAAQAGAAIERARLVRQVAHKHRLEAIGAVATGVAHELRNPLFGISSAAQLLRFRAREDVVVEKNVGRILREVDRLNKMVTSLLEFGRPKPIALVMGDPDGVWDEVLEGQRGLLESRVLVVRRIRPTHASLLQIDPEQLSQVFLNLLVNAADHAPAASDLVLESSCAPRGIWRCRLTNAGPAIPPNVLPHVFEMFFSDKPGGTGIGLALCQRIVAEHGGDIEIESTPEAGTTVSVSLPPPSESVA